MDEASLARDALIGEPIAVEGEQGAYCQKCLFDDVLFEGADQDEYNVQPISAGEPVCVTASRRAENHPQGATNNYKIFDLFHPYHLVPGVEIEGEEWGYHEVMLSTTAVASESVEPGVVIGDDPEIIDYSPPTTGLPLIYE